MNGLKSFGAVIGIGVGLLLSGFLLVEWGHQHLGLDDGTGNWVVMGLTVVAMTVTAARVSHGKAAAPLAALGAFGVFVAGMGGWLLITENEGRYIFFGLAGSLLLPLLLFSISAGVVMRFRKAVASHGDSTPEALQQLFQYRWMWHGIRLAALIAVGWWLVAMVMGAMRGLPIYFMVNRAFPLVALGGVIGSAVGTVIFRRNQRLASGDFQ